MFVQSFAPENRVASVLYHGGAGGAVRVPTMPDIVGYVLMPLDLACGL